MFLPTMAASPAESGFRGQCIRQHVPVMDSNFRLHPAQQLQPGNHPQSGEDFDDLARRRDGPTKMELPNKNLPPFFSKDIQTGGGCVDLRENLHDSPVFYSKTM